MDPPALVPLTSDLRQFEKEWSARYPFFKDHGYLLRPRYIPGREPDWKTSGVSPMLCEDFIPAHPLHPNLMDATRKIDGKRVYIKRLSHGGNEADIAAMLSPPGSTPRDSHNHAIPLVDIIRPSKPLRPARARNDSDDEPPAEIVGGAQTLSEQVIQPENAHVDHVVSSKDTQASPEDGNVDDHPTSQDDYVLGQDDEHTVYLVMPLLLTVKAVPFETVDDIVDFAEQLLEGIVYMHAQGVAHRDCSIRNILVDADALFPKSFHPIRLEMLPDGRTPVLRLSRSSAPVTYYFADYGISSYFDPKTEQDRKVVGVSGIDQDVPELSLDVPYDPFKVDVFLIGNLLKQEVYMKFKNVGFLEPLFRAMTATDPAARPDAVAAYGQWTVIRKNMFSGKKAQRLRSRDEGLIVGFFVDVFTAVQLIVRLPGRAVTFVQRSSRRVLTSSHS
ncbi:hypothetical protein BDY19DRAFT_949200 [Irpex rosettiformis]|uniref:Uncharacterized protein n=1 Tax=Irpex rosettiformis TaxID=378272 RepID=A0ACB8U3E5_9APHY|nr:hypothetical protein BDY19DRAFT_949200 [Irpex rosettiformis]